MQEATETGKAELIDIELRSRHIRFCRHMRQERTQLFPPLSPRRSNVSVGQQHSEILFQSAVNCVLQRKPQNARNRFGRHAARELTLRGWPCPGALGMDRVPVWATVVGAAANATAAARHTRLKRRAWPSRMSPRQRPALPSEITLPWRVKIIARAL